MAQFELIVCLWMILGLAAAEVVPFIEPGFFFAYGKTPVTEQCETVRLIWGRQGATGQNPVAPYSFQVLTSTFIFPFIIDAGTGGDAGDGNLFFDFTVPFAPGTQYQICMFAVRLEWSTGRVSSHIYHDKKFNDRQSDVQKSNDASTNSAFEDTRDSGWRSAVAEWIYKPGELHPMRRRIDKTTERNASLYSDGPSLNPSTSCRVSYALQVSPPNHPPYNITSHTMDPIVWTVSLSRAMPFWLSLVSSEGLIWANGPMGVGRSDVDTCLAPDTILKSKARSVAAGAGVGGLFGGFFLVGVAFLLERLRSNRRNSKSMEDVHPWRNQVDGGSTKMFGDSSLMQYGYGAGSVEVSREGSNVSRATVMTGARVFVRHQDGGRVASPMPEEQAEIVELPPRYVNNERVPRVLPEKPLPRSPF
ncbi:hypothetical protein D9757_009695 [Collybiopsis confluens]|uniref:Uncharacterized protein n=1 Tax=Collybiopsis confluens TaxID=2823264 RepID=A0A8H5M1P7_9AGAR|nr:hypothetical protein D9757_009695 [Collybiopsis confluens]